MAPTPHSERTHIIIYGRTNSGKSSLINALTGQEVALTSPIAGTTTDPVRKAMEVKGLGACTFVDTAGFDDPDTQLGKARIESTLKTLPEAQIALVVIAQEGADLSLEYDWIERLRAQETPVLAVLNKCDSVHYNSDTIAQIEQHTAHRPILTSATQHIGIEELRESLAQIRGAHQDERTITGNLVSASDTVLLVMPQDAAAPKGRLILPQVQTIRELIDKGALPLCCTPENMPQALQSLAAPPKVIITDSQAFATAYEHKPQESLLTSFSVLFAAYKGDIDHFIAGARAIATLTAESRVLIAEACTHAPETEDIGTVKIPKLLRKRFGEGLRIDMVSGKDFPQDLTPYHLIIHCGACMFTRQLVLARSRQSQVQQVPMTNYGMALAYLTGILDKVSLPTDH